MNIGDIPNEMKNENYVLIECPLLAFKYPISLPPNTAKREQILTKVHMEGRKEFRDNLLEATKRRKLATEASSKQSEDERSTTINILVEQNSWRSKEELEFLQQSADELFQPFMSLLKKVEEFHYARRAREQKMAQDTDREKPNQEENESQRKGPDPSSQAKSKVEGYAHLSEDEQINNKKTPCGKLYEYMIHNRGDHWLLVPFKAPIIKGDGFVITIGDIPDEVKTEDWLIAECPLPAIKYPILPPANGAARAIIIYKAHKECVQEFTANLREAIKGAMKATLCWILQAIKGCTPNYYQPFGNGRQMEENLVMSKALAEQLKLPMSVVGDLKRVPGENFYDVVEQFAQPVSQVFVGAHDWLSPTFLGATHQVAQPIDEFALCGEDIPDKVKREDWLIAECPLPAIKYPILPPANGAARAIIIYKAHKECVQEFTANLREAIKGAKKATLCCNQGCTPYYYQPFGNGSSKWVTDGRKPCFEVKRLLNNLDCLCQLLGILSSKQSKDAPPTTINLLEMGAVNGRQMEENLVMSKALAEQLKLLMSVVGDLKSHNERLLREQKMARDADREKPNREENEGQREGPDP
ncbi:hypothetical protein OROGR_018300 [Orobanche gracilis]